MENWLLRQGDEDQPGEPQRVHDAQWLLRGHNAFGRAWYTGAIDGDFGAGTAAAARRAKFELGYPDDAVLPTFGPILRLYLLGERELPQSYRARARLRRTKFVWPTRPHGTLIGFPGQGTHSFTAPPNNWESDNAWDIGVPFGSAIVAVADGKIGPSFGPLPDPDPRFHGLRLHLETADNEFYYAHLSAYASGIAPGAHVRQGDLLGRSGSANGVNHLHIGLEHLVQIASFAP